MPVINLPKDTRFGELGAGLGNLVGGIASAYADRQVSSGVAEIMQDPSIAQSEKPSRILKDFGDKGYEYYKKLIQTQVFESQIKDNLSQIGARDVKRRLDEAKLPFATKAAEIDIAKDAAQTRLIGEQATTDAAMRDPRVQALQAQAGENQVDAATKQALLPGAAAAQSATTQLNRQKAGGQALENQLIQNQLDQREAFRAGEATGAIDAMFDKQLESFRLTPQQKEIAIQTYKANEGKKAGTGFDAMIDRATKYADENNKVVAPTNPQQAFLDTTARQAASTRVFVSDFAKGGAQRMGLTEGAWPQVIAEKLGIPGVADPQLVQMYNSTLQQVQSAASNTGGFYSDGLRKMAKDVTASVTNTPMHAIIATDQVADRVLAALEIRKKSLEGTKVNLAPYDQLIQEWRDIKATTGTFKSDVVPNTRYSNPEEALRNGRTILFFNGAQIDSQFNPLVKNDNTQYVLKGGAKATGEWIFERARAKNIDPYQYYLDAGGKARK